MLNKKNLHEWKKWSWYFLLLRGISYLPRSFAYRIASLLNSTGWWQKESTKPILAALAQNFPELSADKPALKKFFKAHYGMQGREMMDVLTLSKLHNGRYKRFIEYQGLEHIEQANEKGKRGTILIMTHFGRPIMLGPATGDAGYKIHFLTTATENNEGFSKAEQQFLALKMNGLSAHSHGQWFTLGQATSNLYQVLQNGEIITILFDVYVPGTTCRAIPFLDGYLRVPVGIERMAKKTGARLVYGVAKDNGHKINAEVRPLPEDPVEGVNAAVLELERDIKKDPWQWWLWNVFDVVWSASEDEMIR